MSRDPAYWPWTRILFACLAALALAVALLLWFGGSVGSDGEFPVLPGSGYSDFSVAGKELNNEYKVGSRCGNCCGYQTT